MEPNSEYDEVCEGAHVFNVDRYKLVYRCEYDIRPEVQHYYYHPDPGELDSSGKPILLGSPTFEGPGNTKWHVTTTFNRWVNIRRYLPLYLTRVDKEYTPSTDFQIQCEFRLVDKNGSNLHSMRSKLVPTDPGKSRGFTKFLPFEDIKKVLTEDNKLLVEAHITFLCAVTSVTTDQDEVQYQVEASRPSCSELSAEMDVTLEKHEEEKQLHSSSTNDEAVVPEDETGQPELVDLVLFTFGNETLGYVNRDKLLEKSPIYQCCVAQWPESLSEVNVGDYIEDDLDSQLPQKQILRRKIVKEFMKFINEDRCDVLENGTYEELHLLFEHAKKWSAIEVLSHCITSMTLKVTIEDAAVHALLLREYCKTVDIDEDLLQYFRQFFRKNLKAIKSTPNFQANYNHREYFCSLAVNPKFDLQVEHSKI